LVTPTLAGDYTHWVANNAPVRLLLVLAGVLITCCIVAFAVLLGTGVAARLELGQRVRAA
jgi:hypothetical protein